MLAADDNQSSRSDCLTESSPGWARWYIALWVAAGVSIVALTGLVVWGLMNGWLRDWAIWARPFAPFSTAFVALLASGIALLSYAQRRGADIRAYEQRRQADDRAEWWRRSQAAIDIVTDKNRAGRSMGVVMLNRLQHDPDVTSDDRSMLREAVHELVSDLIWTTTEYDHESSSEPSAGKENS